MNGKEVKTGTAATITCAMSGLDAEKPLTVTWVNADGTAIQDDQGITLEPAAGAGGKCYMAFYPHSWKSKTTSLRGSAPFPRWG